ncbi:MAG: hypothetical protein HFJ65_01905 [Eggerthellaceae bacterium]|nr:hypothetical protein [Eggerthellaceae bacterium]
MERIGIEELSLSPSGSRVEELPCERLKEAPAREGFGAKMLRASSKSYVLAAAAVCALLVYAGGAIFADSYDNDVWFFLSTGEYIAHNGIPYTNPFSIIPDMGFIAQQWLHCLISYLIYSSLGFVGLGVYCTLLFLLMSASLVALGVRLRGGTAGIEVACICILICVIGAGSMASVRPHLYSMLAFIWIIWFLEGYKRTGNPKCLIAVPIICALHVNLHAAIAPFDLVIVLCYALPDWTRALHSKGRARAVKLVGPSYPKLPVLLTLAICALALFANPYGVGGALYVFISLGSASYGNRISEMNHFIPFGDYENIFTTLIMLICVLALGSCGLKRLNQPLAILAVGCIFAGLAYGRNQWMASIFCGIYLLWATKGHPIPLLSDMKGSKALAAVIVGIGACGMVALMVANAPKLASEPEDGPMTPVKTMDYLESIQADAEDTDVFTFFNAGGYIEFRGYKVNVDARPEIWDSNINRLGYDYYKEYVEMSSGNIYFNTYNEKYDFDVFVIDSGAGTDPYFEDDPRFQEIQGGDGYRAWAKVSWLEKQPGYEPQGAGAASPLMK